MLSSFFQAQASPSGTLPSNTIPNPKGEMKAITTRSGVAYEGPSNPTKPFPKKVVERETEEITDEEQNNFQGSTAQIPPPVIPKPIPDPRDSKNTTKKSTPMPEPEIPKTLPKPTVLHDALRALVDMLWVAMLIEDVPLVVMLQTQLVDTETESDLEEAPLEAEESHPLGSRVTLISEDFKASEPSGTRTVSSYSPVSLDSTAPLSPDHPLTHVSPTPTPT
ncbi:hypothetical protein Tco_0408354 [Tanacetum coccineum]